MHARKASYIYLRARTWLHHELSHDNGFCGLTGFVRKISGSARMPGRLRTSAREHARSSRPWCRWESNGCVVQCSMCQALRYRLSGLRVEYGRQDLPVAQCIVARSKPKDQRLHLLRERRSRQAAQRGRLGQGAGHRGSWKLGIELRSHQPARREQHDSKKAAFKAPVMGA